MTRQKIFRKLDRCELYPTDISVQFRFKFAPSCLPSNFLRAAKKSGLTKVNFENGHGLFRSEKFGCKLPISVERAANDGDIRINVSLSTLQYVWEVKHDHDHNPSGRPNLPHPDEVSRNKCPIWNYAGQMLHHVSLEMIEFMERISANIKDTSPPQLINMRMKHIDVSAEVATSRLTASVASLMPGQDPSSEHGASEELGTQESQCPTGYRNSRSERYGFYSIASTSFFLIGKLTDVAIRSAGIDDVVSCEPGGFFEFFDQVAAHVAPKANEVILACSTSPARSGERVVSVANTR